jgi:hypothetical protein
MTAVQEKEKEEGVSPHAKIKRQKDGASVWWHAQVGSAHDANAEAQLRADLPDLHETGTESRT